MVERSDGKIPNRVQVIIQGSGGVHKAKMEAFDWLEVMKRFLLGYPAGREVGTAASVSRLLLWWGVTLGTRSPCSGHIESL